MKTTKMKFSEDKFVNGECVYQKGKTYDIPQPSVERWIKRGGVIVNEGPQIVEQKVETPKDEETAVETEKETAKTEVKKKTAVKK